jgi:MSHA biogenesis protein MshP
VKKSYQIGIGLPAAIFVITLMAVIAVAVNQLVSQNAQTFEEEVNFTRAFYAAESGAGFAMNGVYPPEEYPTYTNVCTGTEMVPITYDFTADGLSGCTAEVYCTVVMNGGNNYATIQSEGSCGDVVRTVQVRTVY